MKHLSSLGLSLSALASMTGPAFAASKNPLSTDFWVLSNTDFIVLISFVLFILVLMYFKVPGMAFKILDARAAGIQSELDEAKQLREDAQSLLASYERKYQEVQAQADAIVEHAKKEAEASAAQAKTDLEHSIARRLAAARDQIASAQASVLKDVRDEAISIAVAAARDVIAKQMTATQKNALIDSAIEEAASKLH